MAPSSTNMAPTSTTSGKAPVSNQEHGVEGGKAPRKAIKGTKGGVSGDNHKRKKKRKETYSSYIIYKALKQVHPDTGISTKALLLLNSFVNDIFERIAAEACKLASYSKKCTVSSRELQTSVRLILPGELSRHAMSEGTKAVTKFSSNKK
ncbi:hypothetical protein JCM5296_004347 [Sporobolomyces johnsonii]